MKRRFYVGLAVSLMAVVAMAATFVSHSLADSRIIATTTGWAGNLRFDDVTIASADPYATASIQLSKDKKTMNLLVDGAYPGYKAILDFEVHNDWNHYMSVTAITPAPTPGLIVTSAVPTGPIARGSVGKGTITVEVTDEVMEGATYEARFELRVTGPDPSPPDPGPRQNHPGTSVLGYVSKRILPEPGGSLAMPDGRFEVIVPPGMLAEPTSFGINTPPNIKVAEIPGKSVDSGQYEVGLETDDGEQYYMTPGDFFVRYTEPAGVLDVYDAKLIHIKQWHEGLEMWIDLPTLVDQAAGQVTARTNRSGVFALVFESEDRSYANVYHHWGAKECVALASLGMGDMRTWYSATEGLNQDGSVTFEDFLELMFKAFDFTEAREHPGYKPQGVSAGSVFDRAVALGIMSKQEVESLKPDDLVGRLRGVLITMRLLGVPINVTAPSGLFLDMDEVPNSARNPLGVAAAIGLVEGYPDKAFKPNQAMTRAEACALIWRMVDWLSR